MAARWSAVWWVGFFLCGCTLNASHTTAVLVGMPKRPEPLALPGKKSVGFAVLSGKRTMIYTYIRLNADCSNADLVTIRIMTQPGYGTALVQAGQYYPTYKSDNQRYVCNLKPHDGVGVFYRSLPGYLGTDALELQVITPRGDLQTIDYHLYVK